MMTPRRHRTRSAPAAFFGICATALALVGGCVEPGLVDIDEPDVVEAPEIVERPPLELGPLRDEVRALRDNLHALDAALERAEGSTSVTETREAAAEALALLVTSDDGSRQALLPHESTDRTVTPESPALLVTALGAAGDVGGPAGTALREVVADGIAGDLGGWQRDAAGMVAWARDVADPRSPLDTLQATILDLPGDGLRALAWTLLLADANEPGVAHEYAQRARAHVGLMLEALDRIDLPGNGEGAR